MTGNTAGSSAFPTHPDGYDCGMDLRTYIATQALVGLLSSDPEDEMSAPEAAEIAVRCADNLIAELNK